MTKMLEAVRVIQGHGKGVRGLAFSPDGTLLATGSMDKSIKLWAVESGELVRTINGHRYSVHSLAFSPNGNALVAGSSEWFDKGEVRVWEVSSGELQQVVADDCDGVDFVQFSPSGQEIAVVTGFGCGPREPVEPKVRLFDFRRAEPRLDLGRENCIAFSPDGETLAVGGPDCKIKLHHAESGELIRTLTGQQGNVFSVAFSPDGTRLVSGNYARKEGGTVQVWDVASGECRRSFGHGERSVTVVAFLGDGKTVATNGKQEFCRLWDVETGEIIARTDDEPDTAGWGPRYFAISPDGPLLATASDEVEGAAKLWTIPS